MVSFYVKCYHLNMNSCLRKLYVKPVGEKTQELNSDVMLMWLHTENCAWFSLFFFSRLAQQIKTNVQRFVVSCLITQNMNMWLFCCQLYTNPILLIFLKKTVSELVKMNLMFMNKCTSTSYKHIMELCQYALEGKSQKFIHHIFNNQGKTYKRTYCATSLL